MDNPLEQPAPDDPIARVHAFACDLAWGVKHGMWGPGFRVPTTARDEVWITLLYKKEHHENFERYIKAKWNGSPPESSMMKLYGYIELDEGKYIPNSPAYTLTHKAFALLKEEQSRKPLKVFIAYKHSESAALASFLEEGLDSADLNIDVFTDRKIPLGDLWQERLEQVVRECDVFICLFGQRTLESKYVREEFE